MWLKKDISSQDGKTAIVTGANTGIGYESALALYEAGANIIIASRDAEKAHQAIEKIQLARGKGQLDYINLDLSSLKAVKQFSKIFLSRYGRLDLLINNAGIMIPPEGKTDEGFELQFGVNFLGHFALTGYLYPLLKKTSGARVVTVSSGAHHYVKSVDLDNLKIEKSYDANREYAISKFAQMQFVIELQRRLEVKGNGIISVGAHPGVSDTGLSKYMSRESYDHALKQFGKLMPASQGALPSLYAATSPVVTGGGYYGPDGPNELQGYPAPAKINEAAKDQDTAAKLWNYAEKATGIQFPY